MSPSHEPPAPPNDVLMMTESQWIFTESELLQTPSILDGLSPEKERENRGKGVNFIFQVGIMLKLPQVTLATASVLLHRFFMRHSMVEASGRPAFHYYSMAATSVFLATKIEEDCRKMKELVVACVRVAQKDPHKLVDEQDKEYWRWRDNILHNEDILLEALCFDLTLEPPYKILFEYLTYFGESGNRRLRNSAWAFINDSCMTTLCLQFPSRIIAAAALYAALKHIRASIPDDEDGNPWWDSIGVDLKAIKQACNHLAGVYEHVHAKNGRDVSIHERTPEHGDESTTAKTRAPSNGVASGSQPAGYEQHSVSDKLDGVDESRKRGHDAAEASQELPIHDSNTNGHGNASTDGTHDAANYEPGDRNGADKRLRTIDGHVASGEGPGRRASIDSSRQSQASPLSTDNISEEGEVEA
ncbi:MAG: hypothetical protein Q9220_000251 [cf. Caloplaca sp. 1 TL-2023]